jgi:hypothetical protein
MNTKFKIALAVVAGAALGAVGSTTPVPRAMGIWRRGVTDDSRPLFRSSRNTTYTFRHECC